MNINQFLAIYQQRDETRSIIEQIKKQDGSSIHLTGLTGSSAAVIAAAIHQELPDLTQLFILSDAEQAHYFHNDLSNLLEGKKVLLLPTSYKHSYQVNTLESNAVLERAEVLNRLSKPEGLSTCIVTYPEALCERVISQTTLNQNTYELRVGDPFDLDFFVEFLAEHEFERADFVYEAGQFSIRGGIVDVFSFSNEHPYRIELNGNEIESIRSFDPVSQLSNANINHFSLIPNVQEELGEEQMFSFFDYLPKSALVWIKDTKLLMEQLQTGLKKAISHYNSLSEIQEEYEELPRHPEELFEDRSSITRQLQKRIAIELGNRHHYKPQLSQAFNISPQPFFHKNFELLIKNLKEHQDKKYQNLIFSETNRQIERLYTIFEDVDRSVDFAPIYHGLSEGFIDQDLKLVCFTEHQIFDRYYRYKRKKGYSKNRILTLKELKELKKGDFVTHIDHGIGQFAGLQKIEVAGKIQETVRLIYKDNDMLYVGINSLHKISKYVGKDGKEPRMNKLGSEAWEKLKTKTKKKVKDIARDLIKLYAQRKAQEGFAFSPDSYMQVELEASFMYEDTPDQTKATEDFKKDMESPHPMDRLVCGDVGFGKTEIAIRAAFKAVCDSKQVAILVPTTILANQHYRTFKQRLADFPCNIDYLNRFRRPAEQKAILEKLKTGKIDIIIGTHKLLSKSINFKNLGLLIIDEEQKFGVAAKEKLKALKVNVDTLTLTATPIPRTLHFSLMGARDLSIINTPPPNRQPVTTELHAYNDEIVRNAINYETDRGGQVFFIHHRVRDIHDIANRIRHLCPQLNVGVAHGQMEGETLEDVMIKFIEGDYDVLVSTTIIESGLDIPNANTIIINNAHMFGLSDLHQMRGRVGRSNIKANCYLLCPALSTLTQEARRRLQAIEEFSELGSGFNVAMRDLDIRGAGNLLGGEQSGFIAEIGFEMYHKILDEAITELKDEEFKDVFQDEPVKLSSKDCQIETDFEVLIPDHYVRSSAERLSLYEELSSIETEEALQDFREQLRDRFGPVPEQVDELLDMMRLRSKAQLMGFEKLSLKNNRLMIYFPPVDRNEYYASEQFGNILKFVQAHSQRCQMKQSDKSLRLIVREIPNIQEAIQFMELMVPATVAASS